MMKLTLTGPGYEMKILSDPHDQEMMITIQHFNRAIASADLGINQILLLKEHIDFLLKNKETGSK